MFVKLSLRSLSLDYNLYTCWWGGPPKNEYLVHLFFSAFMIYISFLTTLHLMLFTVVYPATAGIYTETLANSLSGERWTDPLFESHLKHGGLPAHGGLSGSKAHVYECSQGPFMNKWHSEAKLCWSKPKRIPRKEKGVRIWLRKAKCHSVRVVF